ncbi:MAG: fimbrillin family protein, partial [Bacteroidaceae bacterium]
MKLRSNNILWFFLPLLAAACNSNDDIAPTAEPLSLAATIEEGGSFQEEWSRMLDRRIAIGWGGQVKKYLVDETGRLTSSEPFVEGGQTGTLTAWYPYAEVKPEAVVVKASQRIPAYYQASNLMEAQTDDLSASPVGLVFAHRTCKLVCRLTSTDGQTAPFGGARIDLLHLGGVETGTTVQMSTDRKAYIAPQSVPTGTDFLSIRLQDGRILAYTTERDLRFEAGTMYQLDVTLSLETGLVSLQVSPSLAWEGDTEEIVTDSPSADAGGEGAWGGGSEENADGSSSGTNPGGTTGGWNGNEENANGNAASGTQTGGSGTWNGNEEGTEGSSSGTQTGGNGTWNGNEENTEGTTSGTQTGGSGTWNGNEENTEGTTSGTQTGSSGTWNGNEENTEGTTSGT